MEDELPLPLPDRRTLNNNNSLKSSEQNIMDEKNKFKNETNSPEKAFNDLKESKNSISTIKIMQTEDMRNKILSYKLLSDKTMYINVIQNDKKVNKCNIILFGPSGGGKSSFIRSLYRALYNSNILPSDTINKLIIRKKYHNEGSRPAIPASLPMPTPNGKSSTI